MLKYIKDFNKWQWLLTLVGLFVVLKIGVIAIGVALLLVVLVCGISVWDKVKSAVRVLFGDDN